ncbi:hypothetical protein HRR83_001125 [Exophiala dermatitidis]|uniref:Zn(2)-C6 fungal-type domain-containing protein n=2 Tax=Exophiala dermatitidis TaxID=5970 RepID=H6C7A7_EXODN|nr:uncharacterized protein HMPREF1120_07588 [Exophiala dermatitidis NIH/UT8656]KAJ4525936.1 hypothetical protein HRR74_001129 [Exophiala dermatitidis]EHY59603.1 hypothetical protein HMPREF1120_07588 [Exophiala dermatitidis NIH/UT8656]KAJ4527117.1 hypothetical protein HRR73_001914 [Exophiala dermatitidis]KAJ4532835.1 hypothetical protein HRR76_007815 [Exophiala dermatitidis]KAJ4538895.1 hypothetical protein HRR77_006816 [Exophiala dermatitidis]
MSGDPIEMDTKASLQQLRSPETLSALQDVQRRDSQNMSESPDSAGEEEVSGLDTGRPKRAKRSRACVACRNMKIRCLPVEGQQACSSCAKVNRQCIMPGPPRKRQKTVHKVAELEKKINALTDALLAKGQQSSEPSSTHESPDKDHQSTSASTDPPRTEATTNTSLEYDHQVMEKVLPKTPEFERACNALESTEPPARETYVDVIERGILSFEAATAMFNYWVHKIASICPLVLFPPGTEVQDIRARRPMSFLALLTVVSPLIEPSVQPALSVELNRQLSERVLFHGDKSLDLTQAMLVHAQYYLRPRGARDLAFNQYIHSAIVMSLDLGIGKRSKIDRTRSPAERTELARTWLGCYISAIAVSTILRLPAFIKFNSRIEECLEILANSPYSLPSDKWLCSLVRLLHLAEEVSVVFNMDDPGAELNFTEARTQHQLKYFQRQLKLWEKSVDADMDPLIIQHQKAWLTLYIHEIAIHADHNVDDFRPGAPYNDHRKGPELISSSHVEALTTLFEASHQVLDTWLALDVPCARCLPNMYLVRNAYAMVVLIKLHWIVHAPGSELESVFPTDFRTEHYLDAVINRLAEVSAGGHSPFAEAFGFVFKKLKTWHQHRGGQLSDDEMGGENELRRRQASTMLQNDTTTIIHSAKDGTLHSRNAPSTLPYTTMPAIMPGQWSASDKLGSNLNAAYDAASYGNTNWDQFNFTSEEMDLFDVYMNNNGWMGYLL